MSPYLSACCSNNISSSSSHRVTKRRVLHIMILSKALSQLDVSVQKLSSAPDSNALIAN